MTFSRNALSALAAALTVANVQAADGPAFSTGPTSSDTYIVESWATLTLPDVPSDNSGDLSLWVGMGTSNGDLIQSIAENYDSSDWSLFAYTLVETSSTSQEPIQASGTTADAGTAVTFHYLYDESTGNYTQNVIVGGKIVSTLSTSDGKAEGWGSAVECAAEDCGTVPAHTWSNVSIILNSAYADYIDTLSLGTDVEATMSTSDGGKTWEVGTIKIPSWDFTSESVVEDDDSTSTSTTTSAAAATTSGSASGSSYGSYPSGTSGSAGASSSGSPTTGSYGSGSDSGSGSFGSSSAQPSGGYGGSGFGGGSSTSGSSGAQPSGGFGSSGFGKGSSTSGSSGAQPSGGFGGSGFGGSHSWTRSRIFRA